LDGRIVAGDLDDTALRHVQEWARLHRDELHRRRGREISSARLVATIVIMRTFGPVRGDSCLSRKRSKPYSFCNSRGSVVGRGGLTTYVRVVTA